jgi:hypothetical protein
MTARDYYESIRFTLSDKSGKLRFVDFSMAGQIGCLGVDCELRRYLLSRPLEELDAEKIRAMSCPHGLGCMDSAADAVTEQQASFLRSTQMA